MSMKRLVALFVILAMIFPTSPLALATTENQALKKQISELSDGLSPTINNLASGSTMKLSLPDKETSIEEILGTEYVSFLNEIGVEIIDEKLQVETFEQFKSIGDYDVEYLVSQGVPPRDSYTIMLMYNYDTLNEDLKKEIIRSEIINEDDFCSFRRGSYHTSEALQNVIMDRLMADSNEEIYYSSKRLFFYKQGILMADIAEKTIKYSHELDKGRYLEEQEKTILQFLDYYFGRNNENFPYPIKELEPGVTPFILFDFVNYLAYNVLFGSLMSENIINFMTEIGTESVTDLTFNDYSKKIAAEYLYIKKSTWSD